jgi:hypothetical protein
MKKIYLSIVIGTSLCAATYTKQNRIHDMQKLAEAMTTIETGFFYNNKEIVQNGANDVVKIIKKVKPPIEKGEDKASVKRKMAITKDIIDRIESKANTIHDRYDTNDARAAIQAYTTIVKQCMKCHHQIRHW